MNDTRTPGPWSVVGTTTARGEEVWGIYPLPIWTVPNEADARLIAAAPEMADLLHEMVRSWRADEAGEAKVAHWTDLIGAAEATLAQVRGAA